MNTSEAKSNVINALFFINILWLFTGIWVIDNGVKISTVSAAILLLSVVWIRKSNIVTHIKSSRFVWVCAALCLLTVLTKYFHGGIFGTFQRTTVILLILSLCISEIKINPKRINALFLLAYAFHLSYLLISVFLLGKERPEGNINPNIYAPVFGLLLVFNTYYSIKLREKTLLLFIPLLVFGALAMQSRGVIVASLFSLLVLSIPFLFCFKLNKKTTLATLVFIFLISITALNTPAVNKLISKSAIEVERIQSGDLNSSIGLRIQMLNVAMSLIKDKPITGHGDDFKDSRNEIIKENNHNNKLLGYKTLHNAYLDSWSKLGVLGFLISILLTISPYLILRNSEHAIVGVALSSFTFVISLVDTALLGGTYLLFLISLSLLIKAITHKSNEVNTI